MYSIATARKTSVQPATTARRFQRTSRASRCQSCKEERPCHNPSLRRLVDGSIENRFAIVCRIFIEQRKYRGRLLRFTLGEVRPRLLNGALYYQSVRNGKVQRIQKRSPLVLPRLICRLV